MNKNISIQPASSPEEINQVFSITGTIIGWISGTGGTAVSILGTIVNILWPGNNDDPNVTWNEMIEYTSKLMDKKLDEHTISTANSELNGLKALIDKYILEADILSNNVRVYGSRSAITAESKSILHDTISAAHNGFVNRIPSVFKVYGYEQVLLPAYAHAANLHVIFLRDILINKDKLELDSDSVKAYSNELSLYIKEYIDYCTDTYKIGLDLQKQISWIDFNKYRRDMTLAVLDLIALFPNYDPKNYTPVYDGKGYIDNFDYMLFSKPIKLELTREVYSDVINDDVYGVIDSEHNKNEENFIRPPHLFEWLHNIDVITRKSGIAQEFLSGHVITTRKTSKEYESIDGIYNNRSYFYGEAKDYSNPTSSFVSLSSNQFVYKLSTESYNIAGTWQWPTKYYNITKMILSITTNGSYSSNLIYGEPKTPINQNTFDLLNKDGSGSSTFNNYSHILSNMISIKGLYQPDTTHGYILAFTHSSVDPNNTIATDKITQIPAVKGYYLNNATVVSGPYYTGGDVVELNNDSNLVLESSVKIKFNVQVGKKYRVRIHYASTGETKLQLSDLSYPYPPFITLDKTMDSKSDLAKYSSFKYIDADYVVNSYTSSNTMTIAKPKGQEDDKFVYINKVELIPID